MIRSFSFLVILLLFSSFVSCSKEETKKDDALNDICANSETKVTFNSYEVSHSLLCRYLRLFKKGKSVESIEPLSNKSGTTLAYYVKYADDEGWDIISADKRVAPLLASSSEGSLDLKDNKNPAVQAVMGMILSVESIKISNEEPNTTWKFLEPSIKRSVSTKGVIERDTNFTNPTRAFGGGMWVPVDTLLEFVDTSSARVTSTAWGQGSPWNNFTPYSTYPDHCPVGCDPVAVGQVLYRYIASNPGQYSFPATADVSTTPPFPVSFGTLSNTVWSYLIPNAYNSNLNLADTTSIFLSWLGQSMNATYSAGETAVDFGNVKSFLGNYVNFTIEQELTNNSTVVQKDHFCSSVVSSINNSSPILVAASSSDHPAHSHTFLVDGYRNIVDRFVIRYEFDPDYEYTLEEWESLPSWMFVFPPDYGNHGEPCERYVYVSLEDALYVKMNWGWQNQSSNPNYNNYTYLLRYQTSYCYDGVNMTTSSIYNFSWTPISTTYSKIDGWLHHFSRKNQ